MKKIIAMLLAVVMVFGLVACGGNTEETKATEATQATEGTQATEAQATEATEGAVVAADIKVAMITDYGDINDQSFNQTTYEACKAWCEANGVDFNYYKPNGDSTAERVAMVDAAVVDGYNVIVMPGYAFGGTIVETCEMYPDVKFVALDVGMGDLLEAAVGAGYDYNPDNWNLADYVDISNVFCAVYQEELCGYMAGYAAVKLGYRHLGYLGGMAVPAVVRFGYGWLQGVDAAAVELGCSDEITMEWAYGNQFYGDADITAVMDTWYGEKGVECVFACGGAIWTSAVEAGIKVGGKVVGVDVDQAPSITAQFGEGICITSAMKGLAPTVDTLLTEIAAGNFGAYAGNVVTMGLVSENPEANYVQIAPSTLYEDGKFTRADYEAMVAAMFAGEIVVNGAIDAMPEVSYVVNDYGNIK